MRPCGFESRLAYQLTENGSDDMAELTWNDAIAMVLRDVGEPMQYKDIAEEVAERGLKEQFGATPAATVNAQVSRDIV